MAKIGFISQCTLLLAQYNESNDLSTFLCLPNNTICQTFKNALCTEKNSIAKRTIFWSSEPENIAIRPMLRYGPQNYTRCTSMKLVIFLRKYVYLIKMVIHSIFKVMAIASHTFFPSLWQFVYASPKKLFVFWVKPVIESFFHIFVRIEALFSKCVPHWWK